MNALSDIISSRTDDFFNSQTMNNLVSDDAFTTNQTNKMQQTTDLNALTTNIEPENIEPKTEVPNPKSEIDTESLKKIAYHLKDQIDTLIRTLEGQQVKILNPNSPISTEILSTSEQIIEGVFNGEKMIGSDGHKYSIPPNYASKSKLVEGDMMKLTITKQGRFIYKSISPIERKRMKGELVSDSASGTWSVLANGKTYKILTASVTFWKGRAGDEVIFFVPQSGESAWGAVENIISAQM